MIEAAGKTIEPRVTCDIFCHVIDNFGDAGVCWRLARGLSEEEGFRVTLYIDDAVTLSKITSGVPAELPASGAESLGILVRRWEDSETAVPSDVVIETFGCWLPDRFEEAIARETLHGHKVAWLNLEYLSAEDWVEECHGLPSPHPRLPVTKTFLFPGFTRRTGGVMIENGLLDARDRFSATDRHSLLEALGAREPDAPFNLFFFSYPTAPIAQLAEALASDPRPVQVIAAPGRAGEMLGEALSRLNPPQVTFSPVPAVPQESFDRVLWACDALIIRGEDSFVRAQLAGKPFLWTIYPQEEDTHIVKLNAFLDRMAVEYGEDAARVWRETSLGWNQASLTPGLWSRFRDLTPELTRGSLLWSHHLASLGSLTRAVATAAKKGLK